MSFFVLFSTGLELKAMHLLGRHSATGAIPSALMCLLTCHIVGDVFACCRLSLNIASLHTVIK
jgi:hypothetical protein